MKTDLIWHTEKRKVSDLKIWDKNPRRMSERAYADLKASMDKFNLVEIPAIDTDNTLIAGNQRTNYYLLEKRQNEIIEVRVPNRKLTEEEFKEYNVRSNKNRGEFDYDLLANNFNVDDLLKWGFTEPELGMNTPIDYEGMPEFVQEEAVYRSITLHFKNQEDVDAFGKLLNQEITEKTKYLWHPKQEKNVFKDKEIIENNE